MSVNLRGQKGRATGRMGICPSFVITSFVWNDMAEDVGLVFVARIDCAAICVLETDGVDVSSVVRVWAALCDQ